MVTLRLVGLNEEMERGCFQSAIAEGVAVTGAAKDPATSMEALLRGATDAILMNVMGVSNGWDVLQHVVALPLRRPPTMFLIVDDGFLREKRCVPLTVACCFRMPFQPQEAMQRIRLLCADTEAQRQATVLAALVDRLASDLLLRVGVPPHLQGFPMLREAIKLIALVDAPTKLRMMDDIYATLSDWFEVSVSVAEHAMRHAIETCWMRADLDVLEGLFGYTVMANKATPSNSAFLFMVADRIRVSLAAAQDARKTA